MSKGVTVTVAWVIKPDLADTFVESLRNMFPRTRQSEGFRDIRLLRSETEPNAFLLIEAWDEVRNFQDYARFRTDSGDTADLLAMTAAPPQMSLWTLDPLAAAQA